MDKIVYPHFNRRSGVPAASLRAEAEVEVVPRLRHVRHLRAHRLRTQGRFRLAQPGANVIKLFVRNLQVFFK